MKRFGTLLLALSLGSAVTAQVFNTAGVLRPGQFSLGIAPLLFVEQDNDLGLYLTGGVGIVRGMDLALKIRLNGETYIGGDVEWLLLNDMPRISLSGGMHSNHGVGLDATFNITFPMRSASIYSGLDLDINFFHNDTHIPLWVPIGLEVTARRSLGILMEIDIGVNDPAYNMFGIGLAIYF
jgi:hypothetical protein